MVNLLLLSKTTVSDWGNVYHIILNLLPCYLIIYTFFLKISVCIYYTDTVSFPFPVKCTNVICNLLFSFIFMQKEIIYNL